MTLCATNLREDFLTTLHLCIVQIAGKKTVAQMVVKGNLLAYPFPDPVCQGGIAFWKIQPKQ